MVCFACFLPAIDFIAKENFSFSLVNLVSVESMHDASRAFNYFKSTIGLVLLKFGFCVFIFGKRSLPSGFYFQQFFKVVNDNFIVISLVFQTSRPIRAFSLSHVGVNQHKDGENC